MFKLKEAAHLVIVAILFAFVIGIESIVSKDLAAFLVYLLIAFIIIFVSVFAKKLFAYSREIEIEQKILHWRRWGWYERSYFKKSLPAGLILPFVLVWITYPYYGFIKMLTFLQFDPQPTTARAAKRHGLYRYSELTEWHIAAIAGIGIFASLVLSVFAYIFNFPNLARYSIYYAAWNLLPLGQLDGSKLLFGSRRLWVLLAILVLIGLFYSLFLGSLM